MRNISLGFNTNGNNQSVGRTSQSVGLGKLRNTLGSNTRKFNYCNRNSPDLSVTFNCVFDRQKQEPEYPSGKYQVAVGTGVFAISRDYGIHWELKTEFASYILLGVAISGNGNYILTGGASTPLFYSDNGGKTFSEKLSANNWYQTSMSKSGQYQTAVGPVNEVYVSNDYGKNFFSKSILVTGGDVFLAMSYDGKYQSITQSPNVLYVSDNYGETWLQKNLTIIPNPPTGLQGIAMSGTGEIQLALDGGSNNYLYRSNDYGKSWFATIKVDPINNFSLYFISMSETGKYVLIPGYGKGIYISDDYGNTFTDDLKIDGIPQSSFPIKDWYPCGTSASGQYQSVCDYSSGYIYTSSDYGKNWFTRISAGLATWQGFFIN